MPLADLFCASAIRACSTGRVCEPSLNLSKRRMCLPPNGNDTCGWLKSLVCLKNPRGQSYDRNQPCNQAVVIRLVCAFRTAEPTLNQSANLRRSSMQCRAKIEDGEGRQCRLDASHPPGLCGIHFKIHNTPGRHVVMVASSSPPPLPVKPPPASQDRVNQLQLKVPLSQIHQYREVLA